MTTKLRPSLAQSPRPAPSVWTRQLRLPADTTALAAATLCAPAFALLVAMCVSVRYMIDDWILGDRADKFGTLGVMAFEYMHWTGRYSFSAVEAFALHGRLQCLPCVGSLALLVVSLYIASRRLLLAPPAWALCLTAVFVTAAVQAVPVYAPVFLWDAGTAGYLPPVALALIVACLMAASPKPSGRRIAVAALLVFVAQGFDEMNSVVSVAALVVALALVPAPRRGGLAVLCAVAVAGLLVMAASPGNAVRLSIRDPNHSVIRAVSIAAPDAFAYLRALVVSVPLHEPLILCVSAVAFLVGARRQRRVRPAVIAAAAAAGLAALGVAAFVSAYGLGYAFEQWSFFTPTAIVLLTVVACASLAGSALSPPIRIIAIRVASILSVVAAMSAVPLAVRMSRDCETSMRFAAMSDAGQAHHGAVPEWSTPWCLPTLPWPAATRNAAAIRYTGGRLAPFPDPSVDVNRAIPMPRAGWITAPPQTR